jgi:hypothetical protein
MIYLEWNNPKITTNDLDIFLRNYLGDIYDGFNIEDTKLIINTFELTTEEQEKYIKDWFYTLNDIPIEVTAKTPIKTSATTPFNEHCMQPWGCDKGYFKSKNDLTTGDFVCEVTLSNKSLDGLTFTYNSDIPITPAIGNYIFQRECSKRSWITSFDTVNHTLTVELPNLDNGVGIYSKGYYTDSLVRDWAPLMYLWGLTLNVMECEDGVIEQDPCYDLIELSVVDRDDLFKTDAVCQALFGVDASEAAPYLIAMGFEDNHEYGHWTKYYDESWIVSCNGMYTPAPDGSPGELLPGLYLRLSFFTTENEEHEYHIFVDYYPTSKT